MSHPDLSRAWGTSLAVLDALKCPKIRVARNGFVTARSPRQARWLHLWTSFAPTWASWSMTLGCSVCAELLLRDIGKLHRARAQDLGGLPRAARSSLSAIALSNCPSLRSAPRRMRLVPAP